MTIVLQVVVLVTLVTHAGPCIENAARLQPFLLSKIPPQLLCYRVLPDLAPNRINWSLFFLRHVPIFPPTPIQINFPQLPITRLIPPLKSKIDHPEQRQQNICIHEVACSERTQRRPSLHQRQKHVGAQPKIRVPRIPQTLEWQIRNISPLRCPSGSKPNMGERDCTPDDKSTDTRQVDDISISLARASRHIHHGQRAKQIR